MDLNKTPLFSLMQRRMSWLTQRQTILAHNIANSDTPNFKPKDLSKKSFQRMMETPQTSIRMAQTSGSHIAPRHVKGPFRNEVSKDTYESALGGNAVVLEEQLMKVSETRGAHSLATNLYRKHVQMLKQAIGRDR
jgi:flagellar basal-body rod protein FlgB